jgi:hypothetical protein
MVLEIATILILLLLYWIYKYVPPVVKRMALLFSAIIIIIALSITMAEAALRISMRYATYDERNAPLPFLHRYLNVVLRNQLLYQKINKDWAFDRKEFNYKYLINECGCFDIGCHKEISPGKLKILCMGDSFTMGVGAPYLESYPRILQTVLANIGIAAEVKNCGIGGASPDPQLVLLKRLINKESLDVDLVIYGLHSSDLDNMIQIKSSHPWFETILGTNLSLYGMSHTFRYICHQYLGYEENLVTSKEYAKYG